MAKELITIESGVLSLLTHKVAPNVFDISSGLAHVSIRDQMTRARLLVHDLFTSGLLKKGDSVLVVGAGVGGVCAAYAASKLRLNPTVVEMNGAAFLLQARASHRFVGPFMYEWPAIYADDQKIPVPQTGLLRQWTDLKRGPALPFPRSAPMRASELASHWQGWLSRRRKTLDIVYNVDGLAISTYVKEFAKGPQRPLELPLGHGAVRELRPRLVILAAGLGRENVKLTAAPNSPIGTRFWTVDTLRSMNTDNQTVAVFGGGDGALQDVLRVLLKQEHPLELIAAMKNVAAFSSRLSIIERQLSALEQENRLHSTWNAAADVCRAVHLSVDAITSKFATDANVRTFLLKNLRPRTRPVYLVVRQDFFSKAYLLNRFLVQLLFESMKHPPSAGNSPSPQFSVLYKTDVTGHTGAAPYDIEIKSGASTQTVVGVDIVVVRYGLDKPPMQQIGLATPDTRVPLSKIPLPTVY